VRGLDVGDVLLDALPRTDAKDKRHPLRAVADLKEHEIEQTVCGFAEGVKVLLQVCPRGFARYFTSPRTRYIKTFPQSVPTAFT
jgi:hypothetical protein